MKKTTILFFAFFLLVSTSTIFAQTRGENPTVKSRRIYCVSHFNSNFGGKHGITVFNSGDPSNSMQLLFPYDPDYSIYAGAAANDTYYSYFYRYGGRGPEPVGIHSVNLRTGEEKVVADWIGKPAGDWPKFQDMTYDYTTNTMYAAAFLAGTSYLVKIDLTNGNMEKVVNFERTVATMAASNEGVLYVIDGAGALCTANIADGKLTKIMDTEHQPSMNQSMEFDRTDGTLYWATAEFGKQESYLIKFDLNNKTYENLGVLGAVGTQVLGMYIPFLRAGYDVPAGATEIKAIPDPNGENKATITWKNPETTFGNDPLLEITSLTVSRNGEIIKTYDQVEDLRLGKEMSFEDNKVKSGMHLYSITATNTAGIGEEGKVDCFVGADKPAKVGNLQVIVNAPCKSATLTWEAPTEGEYKGYFDGTDLTYNIVRYPDMTTVVEDLEALTFTDENSGRLIGYTYKVYAVNNAGTSKATESKKVIFGSPLSMPYNCDFIDEGIFNNNWTVIDNNQPSDGGPAGDGNTWKVLSPMGKPYFGDTSLQPAAEYMMDSENIAPNEWLITPPITFEKNKTKVLKFGVRNVGTDMLTVTLGNNNTIESQVIELGTYTVKSKRLEETNQEPIPFTPISIQFGDMTGTYCIGFHLNTPAGNSIIFQMGNVYVGESIVSSINENEMAVDVNVFNLNQTLNIAGEFNSAKIFNASGICVGQTDANQSQISTANWPTGIYYVKVTNGNSTKVLKTVIK